MNEITNFYNVRYNELKDLLNKKAGVIESIIDNSDPEDKYAGVKVRVKFKNGLSLSIICTSFSYGSPEYFEIMAFGPNGEPDKSLYFDEDYLDCDEVVGHVDLDKIERYIDHLSGLEKKVTPPRKCKGKGLGINSKDCSIDKSK